MTKLTKDSKSNDSSHKEYWLTELKENLNTSNLPNDYPRQSKNREFNKITVDLVNTTSSQLHNMSESDDGSSYEVVLSTLFTLLMRYTGQVDITVGALAILREAGLSDKLNPVLLSTQLDPDSPFSNVVNSVKSSITGAAEHRSYPVTELLHKLFHEEVESSIAVTLLWKGIMPLSDRPATQDDLAILSDSFPDSDLYMFVDPEGECLQVTCLYDKNLFASITIERFVHHWDILLHSISDFDSMPIYQLPILSEDETHQVLVEWNDTNWDQPRDVCVHSLFEEQAKLTPDAIAVIYENEQLTYQELNHRANQLAHHLIQLGIGPDTIVAISMERTLDMVISVLGVLKSGGAYVPLDPAYPLDRIAYMLQDSQARVLLTQGHLEENFPQHEAQTIFLDKDWPIITQSSSENPQSDVTVDNLLYVIYTSGSTGQPKGVALPHRALANLIPWQLQNSNLGLGDRTLQFASLSFDVSCQELFSTWCSGGTLVLVSEEVRRDASGLLQFISANGVSRLFLPFVALQHLAEAATTLDVYPSSLREIVTAGEQLQVNRFIKNFFNSIPGCILTNQYGPSESHVVTAYDLVGSVDEWQSLPPIGRPIDNTQIYILDQWKQPVPVGIPGELYIGGVNVARGYLNRPELTAEKFIIDPFSENAQAMLYKTGDLSRFLPDGNIEFLGRIDHQVKIRGFRVELGEIDTRLSAHPAIKQAVVIAREDTPGDKRLVAYLVLNEEQSVSTSDLHHFLIDQLPDYMVPANFVTLDVFPQTPSGKINRRALPAPNTDRPQLAQSYIAPQTETEKFLASVWTQVLKLDRVGIEDNFFELGGNSLLNFHVVTKIKESKGIDLPVVKLFQYSTIHALAKYLDHEESDQSFLYDVIERSEKRAKQKETSGIAIIGMALRFPGANSIDEFWQVLSEGRATTTFFDDDEMDLLEPEAIRHDPHYVNAHGIVEDADKFDAKFFGINPRIAQVTDPQHRVFLELAWAALEDAGYDPDQFDGDIGLYAGMGENSYRRKLVENRPDLIRAVGEFQVMLGNEKDYVATHTSYKLNLTGPSVSMATACSTSLVAIGEAFKSLANHDCDMAISGGISIQTPQNVGYLYQEGGMLSNDGTCRPFDVNAQGTMFNNGAGIIVLRRLEDALAAGDQVLAVIKSVGVNNDGADKVSFTAPSVVGQAKAIAMAQASASVHPETVSYIEAHGTATPLGDPIEIEALTKAFNTQTNKVGYCGIGSVKSNLGHMVAAAGVAGVIKTALALKHKQLPATLHFTQPNPEINIEETPFFVVDRLMDWESGDNPRRAGVSSFGVGGTNAHAILEEAPSRLSSGKERPFQVVMLSAKTEEALDTMSTNLADHLAKHTDLSLADVAYTLQVGRKSFNCRRFAVGQTSDDIIALLREGKTVTKKVERRNPDIVFMFPGQGSQYINMGMNLYAQEPFFKETVDYCAEILTPYLGRDLREVLYPAAGDEDTAAAILKDTFFTQPALFTIEYALAKLWLSWGVIPSAMIGHSIGEYVAACIAGVFSVEDALKIVALRGRLVSEQPGGSMLSVRRPAVDIEPRLSGQLALAASNSPRLCVVAGPDEEVSAFESELQADGIACKHLHTSHAFHSVMMEPVIEPFAAFVGDVSLSAPSIPIISTVTGDWMSSEDATDPQYWARHVRATVRFAEAVGKAWEVPERVLLEIGPRTTSTTLARQQVSDRSVQTAIPSLSDTHEDEAEWQALMDAVGRLWLTGIAFEWPTFYEEQSRHRVSLPTYPFARTRYWADPPEEEMVPALETAVSTSMPVPVSTHEVSTQVQQTLPFQEVVSMSRKERLIPKLSELLEDISGLDVPSSEADVTFLEFGFDSLFLTQASLALKNEFNVELSFRQMLGEYSTLETLAVYIDSQLPDGAFPDESVPVPVATPMATQTPSAQTAISVMPQSGAASSAMGQSAVEQLVAQQLQIMAQQLAMLQGSASTVPPLPAAEKAVIQETAVSPATNGTAQTKSTPPKTKDKKPQPFGAIARITTEVTDDLSESQRSYLEDFIQRYNKTTANSKSFTAEHRPHHADPRAVTGFKPALKELVYPIIVERSEGVHFHDIDGNQYIDVLNGFGSNFMGYGHPVIKQAISQQLEKGYELGPQQILTGEVSKLICEFTGFDRAGFCNTGSEAVTGCMRIARTVTGRSLIAIFSGSYHGIFDEVLVRGTKKLRSLPAAPGVMPSTVENVLVLDYGTEESLRILEERAHELAAIMVEPIQSRRPNFHPREFIHECRRICDENSCAFIFDEVITGFRMGPGGAQSFYGVQADVASYGKVPGGNMPFGMIAGKREWMDALDGGAWQYGDNSVPEVGVTYFAGTFVRHPFAMAGAHAILNYLKENPGTQERLNTMTAHMVKELNNYFEMVQVPLEIRSFSSLFKVFWTQEVPYGELLFYLLRLNGIHIYDGFPNFLTVSFTEDHVDTVVDAFKRSVAELQAHSFLPAPPAKISAEINQPPVPGARFGRDAEGNPAWFVADPERDGKYLQVEREA